MPYTKVSLSLSEDDLAHLDRAVREGGFPSRSAAVQQAVRLLRESSLADAYAEAFAEWNDAGEADAWESAVADGVA